MFFLIMLLSISGLPLYEVREVIVKANYQPFVGTEIIDSTALNSQTGKNLTSIMEKNLPGVSFTRKGLVGFGVGTNSAGQISASGFAEVPATVVLVEYDGVPDIMGIFGHPIPDFIETGVFDMISYERGVTIGYYGSNAVSGRINFNFPRRTKEGFSLLTNLGYNNYGKLYGSLKYASKIKKLDWGVGLSGINFDGDRENDHYGNSQILGRIGYGVSSRLYFEIGGRYGAFDYDDPGPEGGQSGWSKVKRGDFRVKAKYDEARSKIESVVYRVSGHNEISDGWNSDDFTEGVKIMANTLALENTPMRFTLSYIKYGGKGKDVIKNKDYGKFSDNRGEICGSITHIFKSKLGITATGSVNYSDRHGSFILPAVLFEYSPVKSALNFSLGAGRKFRYPTLKETELFPKLGPPGAFKSDPNIRPEEFVEYEFGINGKPFSLSYECRLHYRTGKNLIGVEGRFPNLTQKNLGEFKGPGAELKLVWNPLKNIEMGASGSYEKRDKGVLIGPQSILRLWASGRVTNFECEVDASYLKNPGTSENPLPDVFTLGVSLSYNFKWLKIYVNGDNLLNQEYELIKGYKMPRRNFSIGISSSFE